MNMYDVRSWKFGKVFTNPTDDEIRRFAKHDETTTQFGSASYVDKFRSRSAQFTRTTVDKNILPQDLGFIEDLRKSIAQHEFVQIDRKLGQGEHAFHVRLYVTKKFSRLALECVRSLEPWTDSHHNPDFITVDIPEWNQGERRILVFADCGVSFVLGSDYYGEVKKSILRMAMYRMKEKGGLGLHAGSKEVTFIDKNGVKKTECLLLFGLSGTGKTSLTCHDFGFNKGEETTVIKQDDVVLIDENAHCFGTEARGFYIKTDGITPEEQPLLYRAVSHPEAVLENVWVEKNGKIDFFNSELTSNGRAVVPVREIDHTCPENIDCEKVHKLFFITRNPLMPPIAKLSEEQGALYFMLGESIKTSAADPKAKGEPVREVGTNPFIMGSCAEEGNRIYGIIKKNHLESYLVNTGYIGSSKDKKVKLDDTVFFFRNTLLGHVEWEQDPYFKFLVPQKILGRDMSQWKVSQYFKVQEYENAVKELKKSRNAWLDKFQGLNQKILAVAV
ncbi:MAG: phosphoenolpyruvate carboxykinase [Deltaproteobacteria bacterium]|nr:phosphoenolpyruvate carboxykinase [Deltaproteobacteria bacterium]